MDRKRLDPKKATLSLQRLVIKALLKLFVVSFTIKAAFFKSQACNLRNWMAQKLFHGPLCNGSNRAKWLVRAQKMPIFVHNAAEQLFLRQLFKKVA